MSGRAITQVVRGQPTSDGAGVRLTRIIGGHSLSELDPFLLLDEFGSEEGADYIGGFPDHPHRGFETVTIMLNGAMAHRDSMGNAGHLRDGSVQWMTAGSGIIHSEMPEQSEGLMRGFQLWVNLPAAQKMCAPRYQDIPAEEIPRAELKHASIRVIAGTVGEIRGPIHGVATEPLLLDLEIQGAGETHLAIPPSHSAFAYCFEGAIQIAQSPLSMGQLWVLGPGPVLTLSGTEGSRALICAARPLGEPVARWGPFVMNTSEEIREAMADFRAGRLVRQV